LIDALVAMITLDQYHHQRHRMCGKVVWDSDLAGQTLPHAERFPRRYRRRQRHPPP
jgi:hypothetical protein